MSNSVGLPTLLIFGDTFQQFFFGFIFRRAWQNDACPGRYMMDSNIFVYHRLQARKDPLKGFFGIRPLTSGFVHKSTHLIIICVHIGFISCLWGFATVSKQAQFPPGLQTTL